MKRKHFLIFTLLCALLSSCSGMNFVRFNAYSEDKDTFETIQGEGYYKPAAYKINYRDILRDYPYSSTQKVVTIPSTGNRNLLVIPIDFEDKVCSSLPSGCNGTRTQIMNAFFGQDSANAYQSVVSYFNDASFGKLHLSGKVAPWYQSKNITLEEVSKDKSLVDKIVVEAIDDYKKNNDDIAKYDTDNDGYIDGVAFIYAAEYGQKNTSLWAYESSLGLAPSQASPQVRSYFWASYQYMNSDGVMSKVDAHTYIHETGHLLGLDDYYSRDANQIYKPLGGMDMMDYNLGDHNTFSKMLLDWTRPYVVTGDATIKIKASYKNGDCIIIPAGEWNGSAMDEYLLIELYSPKGLNKHDSSVKYTNGTQDFSLMNKYGIKVYHVDARIAYYKTFGESPFIGYEGTKELEEAMKPIISSGQRYYRRIDHSNTLSNSHGNVPLIEMIDRHGSDYLKQGNLVNNDSLFVTGDILDEFTFNDGTSLNYRIIFEQVSSDAATITIKLATNEQ